MATAWLSLLLLIAGAAWAAEPTAEVQVTPAAQRTLQETVTAYGRVQPDPDRLTTIGLPRAGLVSRVWVRAGQEVQAGDPLLRLETAPSTAAEFQQAQASERFARQELDRVQSLFQQQLATRDQLASAEHQLRDAEAALAAQRKLGNDQTAQVIRAPFDGITTEVVVTQGQRVQADSAAMLLAGRDALVVVLGLEQEDAVRVPPGAPVSLSAVFPPAAAIAGRVSAVHAMVNPATRLVDVLVPVPKSAAGALVLEEAMRGEIVLREVDALAVPRSAVLRDDRGSYVFVVSGGKAHRVAVEPGLEADGWTAVQGDLQAGEPVVTTGNYELTDGMEVREASR
jgi:membrane fusion protein (multidrug efflux system)